jgi:protein O-mannosyl-transferase
MEQPKHRKKTVVTRDQHPPGKEAKTASPPRKPSVKVGKPRISRKGNGYFVLFFFILAYVLYGNTILNKYAVDDEFVTGPDNGVVTQGLKAIPQIFMTNYVQTTGNVGSQNADYRPIVKLTFALEYQLWGEKPGRSHAVNVLIYFFLSTLLFFILKRILKNYNILFPFLITVLFMIHPLHTEVVASLKNRDEMLAFLCGLGMIYYFLRYVENRQTRFIVYALIIFAVGYLCKTSILPFVLLCPLVIYFFTDTPLKKIVPVVIGLLVVVILAQYIPRFFLPKATRMTSFIENPLFVEKNIGLRLGTAMLSLLFYVKMLFYPYPLVYYYGYDTIPLTGLGNIKVLLSILIYLGLLIYAFRTFREKHILSFAILFYMISIFMYSNLPTPVVGIVGERFVFLGSVGFCIALVFVIFKIFRTEPRSLTIEISDRMKILAVVIVLIVPSVYMTIKRNRAWRNLYDLCARDMKHASNSAKVNIQYAGQLMNRIYKAPEQDQASMVDYFTPTIIKYFRKGIEMYPENYSALNDLGSVYINFAQNPDSAIIYLNKAIRIDATLQPAWVNLGLAYRKKQMFDSAVSCYRKVLDMNPHEIKALMAMGNIYNDLGKLDEAVKMNEEAMKVDPQSDVPYRNVGNYYFARQDTATAVKYWEEAARRYPSYDLCMELNSLYRIKGDMQKADYYYDLASAAVRKKK